MKFLLILSFLIFSQITFSQSFKKGTFAIDAGLGFGVYTAKSNDKKDKDDGAGALLIPVNIEYGISNRFGLGITTTYGSFIANPDEANGAYNLCFGLRPSFHFYNGEKTTMDIHVVIAGSGFTYYEEKPNESKVNIRGAGSNFVLGFGLKRYFGNTIGIVFNLDYAGYNYTKFEDDKGTLLKVNTPPEDFQIGLNGVNTSIGLGIKF